MKKIKVALNSVAILGAIGGAFATYTCKQCEENAQYIPVNNSYLNAGEYGIDYNCSFDQGVCTFYYTDSISNAGKALPCREGTYTPVFK